MQISKGQIPKTTPPGKLSRVQNWEFMKNLFGEDFDVFFKNGGGEFSMDNLQLEETVVNERILNKKIMKNAYKYSWKIENNLRIIGDLISELGADEELVLMSRAFDSPSIILKYADQIDEIYIGTWAITPSGIQALKEISEKASKVWVLLDATHSKKWLFASGAINIMQQRVNFKFTQNHSKFMAIKFKDSGCLNVVGSMNLSNNPRWENMRISRSAQLYEFLKDFMMQVEGSIVR